uniref:IBR domain-containing protein n=1 Tax=Panagrolaimus superbus TaxID=310955 RepID=A0A914YQX8_9BILA
MPFIQQKFKTFGLKLPNENPNYQILTTKDIIDEINELTKKAIEIFEGVSTEDCQKLLHEFNWDCNRLLEKYYEADSFEAFVKKNNFDLSVPFPSETMITSFIQSNSLLFKRCPNKTKNCKKVIKIQFSEVEEIICECDFTFCFKCGNLPHSPFPCILIPEWNKQCDEYDEILANNDVICPHCFVKTREVENGEFMTTVCKLIQHFLEKILPLPLFNFFLDKEYLLKYSSISSILLLFEFFLKDLKIYLANLMQKVRSISEFNDNMIFDETKSDILDALFVVQQHLGKILKFVTETKGWIFKIPEIQQAYDKINEDMNDANDDDDMGDKDIAELIGDIDMEDEIDDSSDVGGKSSESDNEENDLIISNDNDNGQENNDIDYWTCDDDMEDEYVIL